MRAIIAYHIPFASAVALPTGAGLCHQPNSLDDLEPSETLPFDDVPVRYDETGTVF